MGDNSLKTRHYQGSVYEDKCGAFGNQLDPSEAIKRAKHFLYHNPHFFYTAMSKDFGSPNSIESRGNMIAVIAFRFILSYGLDPSKVQLIVDQVDGAERSREIKRYLQEFFNFRRINIPIRFIQGAENVKIPTRKADRACYWISALHFLGRNHNWPYRHRRVNPKSLDRLLVEVLHMSEQDYPEEIWEP